MLTDFVTWSGWVLTLVSVPLALYFFFRQEKEGVELGRDVTIIKEITVGRRRRLEVLLDQPSPREPVERPQLLSKILGELFINERHMVVVYGDYGAGKTSLAQEVGDIALHGRGVGVGHFAPFEHGLLSATLGPAPAIHNELKIWQRAVFETDDSTPNARLGKGADAESTVSVDRELDGEDRRIADIVFRQLADRYPLVVIDDARHYGDVEALLAAVPERPVLVTTHEINVRDSLERVSAKVIPVDHLEQDEKVALLRTFIASALDGEPAEKTEAFLHHLSERIDSDPFTVTQTGAGLRDRLQASRGSWRAITQRRLDELVAEAESWNHDPGGHRGSVFRTRLNTLTDPLYRAILRTLSLMRPRPEQFSAAEIAALCVPQGGAGDNASQPDPPDVAAIEDALVELDRTSYLGKSPNEFRFSLHNLSRNVLSEELRPELKQDFHHAAVKYWRSFVDSRDPGNTRAAAESYQIAIQREGPEWLRAARNLIYHLSLLDDLAQARLTFTAIYFELFFWWGFYLGYPALEELLSDWDTMREVRRDRPGMDDDDEWFAAIQAFHHSYTPGQRAAFKEDDPDWPPSEPDYRGENHNWPAVTNILQTILRLTGLNGPINSLGDHDQWHTRALIDLFLADSYRYRPTAGRFSAEIDGLFAEARSLIMRCNSYDQDHGRKEACDWLLSWVDRMAADVALRRALEAPDDATRTTELELARAGAAAAIRAVLADATGTALTGERGELDYETAALASLISGDACADEGDLREAARWYAAAVVLTATWNYRPVTDAYTRTFSGHVSEHVRRALQALLESGTTRSARSQSIAVLHRVLQDGYVCGWGSEQLGITSVDPAVLIKPREVMSLLIGPLPAGGRHDSFNPIPGTLNHAAERTLAWIWDAAQRTPAGHGREPAALSQTGEPAASMPGKAGTVPGT